ncbi:hypothetical protein ACIA6E_20210 [Streptomyces sp. NPDC051815]|uniref:hypothetical protein n=1 Tax=Streptomyces sp. NPDC051815 TaxID=3365674 RepID=UPI003795C1FA
MNVRAAMKSEAGMRTGGKGAARRWGLVGGLIAAVVALSGCTGPIDSAELPGTYRSDRTGGAIVLAADGTFSATDISERQVTGAGSADPVDFSGRWSATQSNFVYLEVEGGELGGDIQLYTSAPKTAFLSPDPEGPTTLELTKTAAK